MASSPKIQIFFCQNYPKNPIFLRFLSFFDQKQQFYVQDILSIMQSNHSSFENGLAFVLIMSTYEYLKQKLQLLSKLKIRVKNSSFSIQMLFFLKCSYTLVPRELDHDIWQIISKLVVFHDMTIGQTQALSSFALEGAYKFLITLYLPSQDGFVR